MKTKLSFKVSSLTIFAYIFLLIKPQIFSSLNYTFHYVFTVMQLFVLVIALLHRKTVNASVIVKLGIAFYAYQLLNTVIQTGYIGYINTMINGVYAIFIIELCRERYCKENLIEDLAKSMMLLLSLNFFLTLIGVTAESDVHNRISLVYFLGRDNQVACYLVFGLMLQYMDFCINKKRVRQIILPSILSLLNLIYFSSGTLIICMAILTIMLIIIKLPKYIANKITPATVSIALAVLFLIITVAQRFYFMADLIASLGKDLTLSSRTDIWNLIFSELSDWRHFLFGFGEKPRGAYITIWTGNTFSAHNLFLQLMLEGGIILLLLYFAMWIYMVKGIGKINNIREKAMICSFLLVYFTACMTEVFPITMNILVIHVAYLYTQKDTNMHGVQLTRLEGQVNYE